MRDFGRSSSVQSYTQTVQPYFFSGPTTICGCCSKVKQSESQWLVIDEMVLFDPEVTFLHGICPECSRKHDFDRF
jgi:hypothetical protein